MVQQWLLAVYEALLSERLAQLISLGATQSSGMSFQHMVLMGNLYIFGLAARNAVWSYELLENTSLETGVIPF
ncbi:MAG: hypothetical protein IPJ92_08180 [Veillonella sp.]|nr:hypothetical protein [Veillonella sp.]